jgi:hypothetical protein
MRAVKATVLAAVAAVALAAAPASAGPHWHGGGGGGWGHHGGWGGGWGGPALVFGLAGAALAAGVVAGECTRWVPTYDDFGNVVGRHPVNAC